MFVEILHLVFSIAVIISLNDRLQQTLDSINVRYYSLVDKLGLLLDDPPPDSLNS